MSEFKSFSLAQPIVRAVREKGYTETTPIQEQSLPLLLLGRDLLGVAQTGTGKTAAFALPLLHRLSENRQKPQKGRPRGLILAPTRELASQIGDSIRDYGKYLNLRSTNVFGGTSMQRQIKTLSRGIDVLVATPGRLVDLMNQGHVRLDLVEIFVLDEADRMLDMGFIHDVRRVTSKLAKNRQTVMFSATMPQAVKKLADNLLNDPSYIKSAQAGTTVEKVKQEMYFVPKDKKRNLLFELLRDTEIKRVLIFTRTKHRADRLAKNLNQHGIESDAIHGDKTQGSRQKALKKFRAGSIRALVATDIAARGIDIEGVTHVINFELPIESENYVHRIGRTARAGASGKAMSLCDHEERSYLRDIEKFIRQKIPVIVDHSYHVADIVSMDGKSQKYAKNSKTRPAKKGSFHKKRSRKNNGSAKTSKHRAA